MDLEWRDGYPVCHVERSSSPAVASIVSMVVVVISYDTIHLCSKGHNKTKHVMMSYYFKH